MYEETAGEHQQLRRAKFLAAVLDRKKLYIDDNLFVGAMAGKTNAMYPYPEWQVDWMIEENTVEKSPTPEDKKANQWALEYWGKRAMKPRVDEIFQKRYGYDPKLSTNAGLFGSFSDWPAGGGNLNYPRSVQRRSCQHDQGGRGAADVSRDAFAERFQVLLL